MRGADCWGLVLMVSREIFGLDLGMHIGARYVGDELAHIIEEEEQSNRWQVVAEPQNGDVVTMRKKVDGPPSHVGIVVGKGLVLHSLDTSANGASSIHPIKTLRRLFGQIEFCRYANNNHTA